jgi:hypothetical protein
LADLADTVIPEVEVGEVLAVPAGEAVARTYVELSGDHLAAEQQRLFAAQGVELARSPEVEAGGLKPRAEVITGMMAGREELVAAARCYAVAARQALSPYVTRPPGAKGWYVGRMLLLLIGDIAAVAGACVLLGEIPALALTLAVSTGMAAVTAGSAGAEAKRVLLTAQRQWPVGGKVETAGRLPGTSGDLPDSLLPWRHLFAGPRAGRGVVRLMVLVTLLIVASLTVGVVALRWSLDGALAGVAFGGFALAVSLASLWNSYVYADDVADILGAADKAYVKAERGLLVVAGNRVLSRFGRAVTRGVSLQAEQAARGLAAAHHVQATVQGVLVRHPAVVGHGPGGGTTAGDGHGSCAGAPGQSQRDDDDAKWTVA